jgi:hypothetical protein
MGEALSSARRKKIEIVFSLKKVVIKAKQLCKYKIVSNFYSDMRKMTKEIADVNEFREQ